VSNETSGIQLSSALELKEDRSAAKQDRFTAGVPLGRRRDAERKSILVDYLGIVSLVEKIEDDVVKCAFCLWNVERRGLR
jgi:hypothetical protein